MKDKENLLNHDQWSAGEYTNTTENLKNGSNKITLNKQYSIIGETSYQIKRISDYSYWSEVRINNPQQGNIITQCSILSQQIVSIYVVGTYEDGTQEYTRIVIPSNLNWNENIELSNNFDSDNELEFISLRITPSSLYALCYCDNLKMKYL